MNQLFVSFSQISLWIEKNKVIFNILMSFVTLILGYIVSKVVSKAIYKAFSYIEKGKKGGSKRLNTYALIISYAAKVVIIFITVVQVFSFLGMESLVHSLFATAGISGIAISFGAQNLVRDIISGLFMLVENQYSVGDYVKLGNLSGRVEEFYPRTTTLRADTGELHIIPNGTITNATNYSRGQILTSINVPFSTQNSPFLVVNIVKEYLQSKFPDDNIKINGISQITGNEYTINCVFESLFEQKTVKYQHILNSIIECFGEYEIKIPGGQVPLMHTKK